MTVISLSQPQAAPLVWWSDNHFSQYPFNLFMIPFEFLVLKNRADRLCFFHHFHLPSKVSRGGHWHLRKYQSWKLRSALHRFLGYLWNTVFIADKKDPIRLVYFDPLLYTYGCIYILFVTKMCWCTDKDFLASGRWRKNLKKYVLERLE